MCVCVCVRAWLCVARNIIQEVGSTCHSITAQQESWDHTPIAPCIFVHMAQAEEASVWPITAGVTGVTLSPEGTQTTGKSIWMRRTNPFYTHIYFGAGISFAAKHVFPPQSVNSSVYRWFSWRLSWGFDSLLSTIQVKKHHQIKKGGWWWSPGDRAGGTKLQDSSFLFPPRLHSALISHLDKPIPNQNRK